MLWLTLVSLIALQKPVATRPVPLPVQKINQMLEAAEAARTRNDRQAALKIYKTVEQFARAHKVTKGITLALVKQGIVYDENGQYPQALEKYAAALKIQKANNDNKGAAHTLNNLGIVYDEQEKWAQALACYREALELHRKFNDPEGRASAYLSFADTSRHLPDKMQARKAYRTALEITHRHRLPKLEAMILNNTGTFFEETGEPLKALSALEKASALSHQVNHSEGEIGALLNQGVLFDQLGMTDKALECYAQVMKQTPPDSEMAHQLQNNLAVLHLNQREGREAEQILRSLIAKVPPDNPQQMGLQDNLGIALQYQDKLSEAAEAHQSALTLARKNRNNTVAPNIFNNLGDAELRQKHFGQAAEAFEQARVLFQQQGRRREQALAQFNLGLVQEERGANVQAEASYLTAIRMLERTRGLLEAKEISLTQNEIQRQIALYHRAVWRLINNGKPEAAFALAQKTKACLLLAIMESGGNVSDAFLTKAERTQQEVLQNKAKRLQSQIGSADQTTGKVDPKIVRWNQQLADTERDFETFVQRIYRRYPELARRKAAHTLTLDELPKVIDEQTALIEFVAQSEEDATPQFPAQIAAFVVTVTAGKPSIAVILLPSSQKLTGEVAAMRDVCSRPESDYLPVAQTLHQTLLSPLENALAGKSRLIICPDGKLWDVPFQALHNGKAFLWERFEVTYALSASALSAAQSIVPIRTGALLVCANPTFDGSRSDGEMKFQPGSRPLSEPTRPQRDFAVAGSHSPATQAELAGAQREAEFLAKTEAQTHLFTRADAQETTIKPFLEAARCLHFATHGLLNDAAPMLSCLLLADPAKDSPDDGFLTARELSQMHLHAELVVLSACNTARGTARRGEGVIGLTWAIFAAGVPTEIISQWSVDDAATAELMTRFYSEWHINSRKSAALRSAALSLLHNADQEWHHPYYWSPFILMGKP